VHAVFAEPRLFAGRFDCGHKPNRLRDVRKLRRRQKARQCRPERGMGVGVAAVSVAPAITNAVYHATGKRIRDLPITLDVEDIREVVTMPVAHLSIAFIDVRFR
jgi:hypothetical protein